jgi:3-hydroxyisobutyrate dehydrogenase-like beta-hydroxyacid dehydrogenase
LFIIYPPLLQELLCDTGADSYQLKLRGKWILNEDYNPRFSVNLALKDVRLGLAMASFLDQTAPFKVKQSSGHILRSLLGLCNKRILTVI